ncbi:hypothetical protein H4R35_002927, partial [Dimargaris xerosporica]
EYIRDGHPKVRKVALDLLYALHLAGHALEPGLYPVAVDCLKDDFEAVRFSALRLVWTLSKLHASHPVPLGTLSGPSAGSSDTIQLASDAFVKVCDMVNDISMSVRTEACVLLGSYHHVPFSLLSQTLSKKVMSHLKRRPPLGKHRSSASADSGSSPGRGKRSMIPVAEGDLDVGSDEFRILDSGACGAFVHGLEDEYREVRHAAINSIGELCLGSAEFAKLAVDYLVDIFNDEIDYVRLNAIQSLSKVADHHATVLDGEQLQIIFGVMEDADPKIRRAIHHLLGSVRVQDQACIVTVVETMTRSAARHSTDQQSIYRCLGQLGLRHSDLVDTALVERLLKLEKQFLTREFSQDDVVYTAHMALIFNAAMAKHSVLSVLPAFVFNHLPYFYDKYPRCFPDPKDVVVPADKQPEYVAPTHLQWHVPPARVAALQAMAEAVQLQLPTLLTLVAHRQYRRADKLMRLQRAQLDAVVRAQVGPTSTCRFYQRFLQVVQTVARVQRQLVTPDPLSNALASLTYAPQLLAGALALEHRYLGHAPTTLYALGLVRVFAHALAALVLLVHQQSSPSRSATARQPPTGSWQPALLERMAVVLGAADRARIDAPQLRELHAQLARTTDAGMLSQVLLQFVRQCALHACDPQDHYKEVGVEMEAPVSTPERPTAYSAVLPLSIPVEAALHWVLDPSRLAVQVKTFAGAVHMFRPPLGHFSTVQRFRHKLTTSVPIQLPSVNESCAVEVSLVTMVPTECSEFDTQLLTQLSAGAARGDSTDGLGHTSALCSLPLADTPVRYYVMTKPQCGIRQ